MQTIDMNQVSNTHWADHKQIQHKKIKQYKIIHVFHFHSFIYKISNHEFEEGVSVEEIVITVLVREDYNYLFFN